MLSYTTIAPCLFLHLQASTPAECKNHLHQLHVCLPSSEGA